MRRLDDARGAIVTERVLRMREVVELTGLSRSTIERRIKDETFPTPRQLGPRAKGWLLSEIEEWMRGLPFAA